MRVKKKGKMYKRAFFFILKGCGVASASIEVKKSFDATYSIKRHLVGAMKKENALCGALLHAEEREKKARRESRKKGGKYK